MEGGFRLGEQKEKGDRERAWGWERNTRRERTMSLFLDGFLRGGVLFRDLSRKALEWDVRLVSPWKRKGFLGCGEWVVGWQMGLATVEGSDWCFCSVQTVSAVGVIHMGGLFLV